MSSNTLSLALKLNCRVSSRMTKKSGVCARTLFYHVESQSRFAQEDGCMTKPNAAEVSVFPTLELELCMANRDVD